MTGGSRGIGAAIAIALAEKGADVAITYAHSADRAAKVVETIKSKGRAAVAIQADSADPTAIARSVGEAVKALGGLDILVNNAAIATYKGVAEFTVDKIDTLFAVNARSRSWPLRRLCPTSRPGGESSRSGPPAQSGLSGHRRSV